ncbi:MAG: hypothetical protein KAS78_02585 [Candidatus Pacebacteria bacterium]|nr:hypothetical protein [Candidatus Paceibacterota bacterium]
MKLKVPWSDFENNELFEGDIIVHPDGTTGTIIFKSEYINPHNQWFVDYGEGDLSRLNLQIGDKGRAVKLLQEIIPNIEEEESEKLINELEKIYKRSGWRDIKQLVIYEAEIKKRLSELLAT